MTTPQAPLLQVDPTGKPKGSTAKAKTGNGSEKKNSGEKKNENEGEKKDDDKDNDRTFTAEQDATLAKMKAENKSWKDIAAETGKPQWALKQRFKELNAAGNKGGDGKAAAKEDKDKQNNDKEKGKGKQPAKTTKINGNGAGNSNGNGGGAEETRFTMAEWRTLQEDDTFSFDELQLVAEILQDDGAQRWRRIAAKFYNVTGRRIAADDFRDKFEPLME